MTESQGYLKTPPAYEGATQAQVEAAKKEYFNRCGYYRPPSDETFAAILAAAAEVGERKPTLQIARTAEVITRAKLDIIERCAQMAEWFSNVEKFTAEDVAARIRTLKDKP